MRGGDDTSPSGKEILWFATDNGRKFKEAAAILSEFDITIRQLPGKKMEMQSNDLEEIATVAAKNLSGRGKRSVFVEDSGLFIRALRGFPGPYSSYVYDTLGLQGVIRLMSNVLNRNAYFQSSVALSSAVTRRVFTGKAFGIIPRTPMGRGGFGFDPIFIPGGSRQTFAQMSIDIKNQFSHRAKALKMLAAWW